MSKLSEQIKQKIIDGRKIWPTEIKELISELEKSEYDLSEYREAERDGQLVVLPCKVGDTVWITLRAGATMQAQICNFTIDSKDTLLNVTTVNEHGFRNFHCLNISQIGKTVFLACEEAEAALKRDNIELMEGNK